MEAAPKSQRLTRIELVSYLSESLGDAKANEVVSTTAAHMGLGLIDYDRTQTLEILERVAEEPGLVGIVARFAKARAILTMK
jgi:hypothetical protein